MIVCDHCGNHPALRFHVRAQRVSIGQPGTNIISPDYEVGAELCEPCWARVRDQIRYAMNPARPVVHETAGASA